MITPNPDFLKVKEDPSYSRDMSSNAIVAVNLQEKRKYLETMKNQANISKIGDMNQRILNLEENMAELKTMLQFLINKSVN